MPAIKVSELKRMCEANGSEWAARHLRTALTEKHLRPEDFSVRALAEGLVDGGREWVESMNPNGGVQILREDAVNTTAFSNVMGQIVYNKLLDSYMMPDFVLSRTIPATKTPFKREKIAGTQRIGDKFTNVPEGHDFPEFGLGEDYIETTETQKIGGIVPVTKEAIFYDRTGQILRNASEVGEYMGLRKEKLISDCVLGNTPWYWTGTTYSDIYSTGLFTNSQSNPLASWVDVDDSRALFLAIKDPYTTEPIMVAGKDVLVSPYALYNARRIFNASVVRFGDGASSTYQTESANPIGSDGYNVMSSLYMHDRLVADGVSAANAKAYWFHGDFAKAFAWMENWPITVSQAQAGNDREFRADIVHQFKVSMMGSASVLDPRYVVRNTN